MSNSVLLKIKRQFKRDEAIAFLQSQLADANFKKGELLSEVSELKHINKLQSEEIAKMQKRLSEPRLKLTKDDLKDERIVELSKHVKKQSILIKNTQDKLNFWRNKWFSLNAKVGNKNHDN